MSSYRICSQVIDELSMFGINLGVMYSMVATQRSVLREDTFLNVIEYARSFMNGVFLAGMSGVVLYLTMLLTSTLYTSVTNLLSIINHLHTPEARCKGNSHCGQFVGQSELWRALE